MQTTAHRDCTGNQAVLAKALYDQIVRVQSQPPHSMEYRQGVWQELLRFALGESVRNPFPAGTASHDAFQAGVAYGESVWRQQCRELMS